MRVLKGKNLLRSITSVLFLLGFASCSASGEYELVTFDLGQQRSIQILASENLEVTQSIYYQVKVDGNIVIPLSMICGGIDRGQLEFGTLLAKRGDLVGIFEKRFPQEILAVHDFKTDASWPRLLSYGSTEAYYKYGEALLKELQAEHQNVKLKLGYKFACG